jgi:poly-gamma-glutamate capsule biosynthesis protein CapA/YwtB (metallophosphatase superfamily)
MVSHSLRLAFAGDVMLGRLVNKLLRQQPPEYPWGETLELIRGADWRRSNLECVVSDCGSLLSRPAKVFRFHSDATNVAVLKAVGMSVVSLANNHTLDFGHEALLDMLRLLDNAGIAHSGAGADLDSASQPAISIVNGLRIGFVSFTDNEPEWEATAAKAGLFYVPVNEEGERVARLLNVIRGTRRRADFIVVAAHWGSNWGYRPPAEHKAFGRRLIDAGADLIFGHSAHVCRGIEIYNGRPILYSTGDFIDDYAVAPDYRNDRSCLFFADLEKQYVRGLTLVPTTIRNCQACIAKDAEAEEITAKMKEMCAAQGTTFQPCESPENSGVLTLRSAG